MKKIKLENGLELEINEKALDDMELLEVLVDLDSGKPSAIPRVGKRLLGEDQVKKLYEHIREDGRVPISKYSEAIKEILDKLGEMGKN